MFLLKEARESTLEQVFGSLVIRTCPLQREGILQRGLKCYSTVKQREQQSQKIPECVGETYPIIQRRNLSHNSTSTLPP